MTKNTSITVTESTYTDLCHWLNPNNDVDEQILNRLLDDELRLPLIYLANKHWLVGPLVNCLKDKNVWQKLDTELQEYLSEIERLYHDRSLAQKNEIVNICQMLKSEGVEVILFKGSVHLFNGINARLGNRFMTDIDLLVPANRLEKAIKILESNSYESDPSKPSSDAKDFHHTHHYLSPMALVQLNCIKVPCIWG
jgi:hypothetical protein